MMCSFQGVSAERGLDTLSLHTSRSRLGELAMPLFYYKRLAGITIPVCLLSPTNEYIVVSLVTVMAWLRCWLPVLSVLLLLLAAAAKQEKDVTDLQIGVKYKPTTCEVQARKGDTVKVHYQGALTDGSVFDSSLNRSPFEFQLGTGHVIKGWDQGLLGMCLGEKRKLKIPAKLGYGDSGSPPKIPGGATLIFDTELVAVNNVYASSHKAERNEL